MVVCKCRKATKLYCFVHKVPVCGECICFPEHQICVIRTYSEWVIDGEYDWPPTCCLCQMVLEDGNDHKTTRLGCMHVIHTNCLVSHLKCFPLNTAPAGYICPACSTPIWPPKNIKDSGSAVHSRLREVIMQEWAAGGAFLNPLVASYKKNSFLEASAEKRKNVETGLEKNLLGNSNVIFTSAEHRGPPPAFASDPLQHISDTGSNQKNDANPLDSMRNLGLSSSVAQELNYKSAVHPPATGVGSSKLSAADIVEIDNTSSMENQLSSDNGLNFLTSANSASNVSQPGAATRKVVHHFDRQNSEISYYADDEDATQKKYIRRGPLRHKFLRSLLPFWSSALPTLPVTAPPRKGMTNADDASEGRARHPRSSRMDPRKILILMALMACMATMAILYYRLAQRSIDENRPREEQR